MGMRARKRARAMRAKFIISGAAAAAMFAGIAGVQAQDQTPPATQQSGGQQPPGFQDVFADPPPNAAAQPNSAPADSAGDNSTLDDILSANAPTSAPGAPAAITPEPPAGGPPAGAPPADELNGLQAPDAAAAPQPDQATLSSPTGRTGLVVTLRALNKITARYTDLNINIGKRVRFASLDLYPRYCDKRPPEEFPETTAFVEIFDRDADVTRATSEVGLADKKAQKDAAPAAGQPTRVFSGWMFASSPGLSALDHPVYDVWVIDCKTAAAGR